LEDLGVDERIILKCVLKIVCEDVDYIHLDNLGISGVLLWTRYWTFRFRKRW